jgi:glycosyltransferase involved in cell wall biosynthesis
LRSLAAALVRRGNSVTIACRRLEGANPVPAGVEVETMPNAEDEHEIWLQRLFDRSRADVVLERYSLSSGPGMHAARTCGVPFTLEVNAPLVDEATRYRGLDHVAAWRMREQTLLRASERVIVVSNALRSHAIRAGVQADRVAVVPNGVDLEGFAGARGDRVRTQYGLDGTQVIGFVGSLKPWHGVMDLVRAFAPLPSESRLLIVGDGPERGSIETEAARRQLEGRVVITGAVRHDRVASYLAAMDIAVAPFAAQPDFYFSPLKVAEYLAAGLPVVTTAQGDLPDLVGDAGLLVPPGSVEALQVALVSLMEDRELRTRMSHAARRRAADLSWDRVAERVEVVLRMRGEKEQTLAGQIQ